MKPRRGQSARGKRIEPEREKAAAGPPQVVTIEKPIYGGAFLARVEGKAVFVPLTLPGEAGARAHHRRQARLRDSRSGRRW